MDQASRALALRDREEKENKVVQILSLGDTASLEEAASLSRVGVAEIVQMLESPQFVEKLRAHTRARATLLFNAKGLGKIQEALSSSDPKQYIPALKLLGQLSGDLAPKKKEIEVKISLESLVKKFQEDTQTPFIDAEVNDA